MCFAHLAQILSGKYIIFDTMQKICAEMRVIMAIAADILQSLVPISQFNKGQAAKIGTRL